MSKFNPKTIAHWNAMIAKTNAYSIVLVDCDDFLADAIDLGATVDNVGGNPLLPGFQCCHAFNLLTGLQTFEADGSKLAYHNLNDYQARYLSGDCRLAFFSPKTWMAIADMPLVQKAIQEYLGMTYNKWELLWFGVLDLFHLTGLFKNPGYKNNSVVCSQLTVLIYKYIALIYNALLKGMDISQIQPQQLLVNVFTACFLDVDSENI